MPNYKTVDELLAINGKIVDALCKVHRGELTIAEFEAIRKQLDPDEDLASRMEKALREERE